MSHAAGGRRLLPVDTLKVLASQLIVLHHLAFYGPMSDSAALLAPQLFDWLARHARIAVQVFLVVGGFLAAQRLLPGPRAFDPRGLATMIVDRYLRLALPLFAALLISIAAAAIAGVWMVHDSIPAAPSPLQVLAHLLLAQDLLAVDALSAGIWYVAIAFQLHLVLLLLWSLSGSVEAARERRAWCGRLAAALPLPMLVALGVGASALFFNRQAQWDVAAPYFFAAYGLGLLVGWQGSARRASAAWWLGVAIVAASLGVDWRDRLGLALLVACGLGAWQHPRARLAAAAGLRSLSPAALPGCCEQLIKRLGQSSYALFLVHFPIAMLVNAAFSRFAPQAPWPQAVGVLLAWACSMAAGELFHRRVERPLMALLDSRRRSSAKPLSAAGSTAC